MTKKLYRSDMLCVMYNKDEIALAFVHSLSFGFFQYSIRSKPILWREMVIVVMDVAETAEVVLMALEEVVVTTEEKEMRL